MTKWGGWGGGVFSGVSPGVGHAAALQEAGGPQKNVKTNQEFLDKAVKDANDKCGSSIAAIGKWDSFGGKLKDGGHYPGLNCSQALEELSKICVSDKDLGAREAVQSQVKTFVCEF